MRPHRRHRISLTALFAFAGFGCIAPLLPAAAAGSSSASSGALAGEARFATQSAAAQHCTSDTVVWTTFSKSKVFHTSGSKYFGKTKHGAYVCEKAALAAGYHDSKR